MNTIEQNLLLTVRNNLNKYILIISLSAFTLIKLPPIYLSSISSNILTTHVLAKLAILILFFLIILKRDSRVVMTQNKMVLLVMSFFLITQTISIVAAIDVFLFMKEFQNYVINICLFTIAASLIGNKDKPALILRYLIITGVITTFLDLIFYLFNGSFVIILPIFLQRELVTLYTYNINRGRYNLYLNTEIFLPFFLRALLEKKTRVSQRFVASIMVLGIAFLSFVSNFRHRLFLLLFNLSWYFFSVLWKKRKPYAIQKILFISTLLVALGIPILFIRTYQKWDVIDRVTLQDKTEDVDSILYRFRSFNKAKDIFLTSPWIGVGLGNYQLLTSNKLTITNNPLQTDFISESLKDPHSIISKTMSETGIIGMLGLCVLYGYFFITDLIHFRSYRNETLKFSLFVSFWGICILSLITPATSVFRGGWTWIIRGLLEGYKNQKLQTYFSNS